VIGARRRVALVTNGLTLAGAETQLVRLATALHHHGDEVRLLSILPTEAFAEELAALDITVVHAHLRRGMRGASAIEDGTRMLRSWRPDVLISFVYQANIVGRIAGRLAGVPVIISSIRNEHFGGRARELLMRATDRLCTLTTTNSELAAASLVRRGIVAGHRLVVVPNAVDPAPFQRAEAARAATRQRLGLADGQFLWLAAGRLEPQKDYPTLLEALARLDPPHGGDQLLIAGQGDLGPELEAQAARLGLARRCRFLGVRADIPELVAACDAVVLSSRWEGLPNVVMEAMAGGRPVVATRAGGTPELVDDGGSGILVDPGEPRALAAAMAGVAGAPDDRRRAMGARGRAIVVERYSPPVVAERWLTLLDDCVPTGGGSVRPVGGSRSGPARGRWPA